MKAITLPAPIATLTHTQRPCDCVDTGQPSGMDLSGNLLYDGCPGHPMVVRWLTADRPPPGDPPWHIAIHADERGMSPEPPMVGDYRKEDGRTLSRDGQIIECPLGAVVATATVETALPIVDLMTGEGDPCIGEAVYRYGDEFLDIAHRLETPARYSDIRDQLDFADWTPGWWAFPLTDVQPTTARCPQCWGSGETDRPCGRRNCDGGHVCSTCLTDGQSAGSCPPIRMRGHAGWWEVTW